MINKEELKEELRRENAGKVKFAVSDIDGILRGKIISTYKFLSILEDNVGFCDVVFGWDMNDSVYENSEVTGWHTGYPDARASIDLRSYRRIPWEQDLPFFLADFSNSENLQSVCPRTLLQKITDKCREMGFEPVFAAEYEWFTFRESPDSLVAKDYSRPQPLSPGMFGYSALRTSQHQDFVHDLFDLLSDFQIPLEGIHTETGNGVYEACIQYTDLPEAADRALLFKNSVKEIASKHELMASFMAKWNSDLPGCGGHIHQSLWETDRKKNLFFERSGQDSMSEIMKKYLAGQLHCLPYLLPLFAPTVNSYKRLVPGSWASTTQSWGVDNRTAALRVINAGSTAMRLENRVPGADANPLLAMAASLASGLYGIEQDLSLDAAPTRGNEYDSKNNQSLPRTLNEAIQKMKSSDIPEKLFGREFIDHFIRTREWEWNQYSTAVTDWELKRYFEII